MTLNVTVPNNLDNDVNMLINDKPISEHIFSHELVNYKLVYRTDEINFLNRLKDEIEYTRPNDYELMVEDIKSLKRLKNDWVYSSVQTNQYISPTRDKTDFQDITQEILDVQRILDYCVEQNLKLPESQKDCITISEQMQLNEFKKLSEQIDIKEPNKGISLSR